MLYCKAILQRVGGAKVATITETQKIVRFRTENTHAGDNERDGLRFDYARGNFRQIVFAFYLPHYCEIERQEARSVTFSGARGTEDSGNAIS